VSRGLTDESAIGRTPIFAQASSSPQRRTPALFEQNPRFLGYTADPPRPILTTVELARPSWREMGEAMDTSRVVPYALGAEEGEMLWGFESLITVKASAEQTGGRFSLLELLSPAGVATPLHVHRDDDETFYVIEGELTFYFDDGQPIQASAGSFVHAPGGVVHAFQVDSETARYLVVTTPQHERFYRGISEPTQDRSIPTEMPFDVEKVVPVAQAYNVEILGPPPGVRA
jgi:quercetin dioxygenase-like cupin family protein